MKFFEFMRVYGDDETIIERLREVGLLARQMKCDSCSEWMYEARMSTGDGIRWRCMRRGCRKTKSIRSGSFFEHVRLGLSKSMLLLHLWSKSYSEKLMLEDFDFSVKTVVDWSRFCRELCEYSIDSTDMMIGGEGVTVELDETVIVKRKYDRGRMLRSGWLFGGIERRDDSEFRCFMCVVEYRNEPLLTHLIRQHVRIGTHIITDGWAAYRNLERYGYTHSVVVHEDNFVSPNDSEIHTQKIESTWSSLKRFIRSHGTNKGEHYVEYIYEWIFRRFHPDVFNV
jgi:hypothetical protein